MHLSRIGRFLPRNSEGKWPLWLQLLVFLAIQTVFDRAMYCVPGPIAELTQSPFGPFANVSPNWQMFWNTALGLLVCGAIQAWQAGFHRVIPFGAQHLRRWTILPLTLWYLAVNLLGALVSLLPLGELPPLTQNHTLFAVIYSCLFLGAYGAMAVMVDAMRTRRPGRAWGMVAVQIVLLTVMLLSSQADMQLTMRETFPAQGEPTTVYVYAPESGGESTEMMDAMLGIIARDTGMVVGDTVVVTDPSQIFSQDDGFEKQAEASNRLSMLLNFLMAIPMFFILRRWIFPPVQADMDTAEEVSA